MNTKKELSTLEIISKGYLWVNLPISILMLGVFYLLILFLNLGSLINILICVAVGWTYWEYSVKKWIKWALDNSVKPDRILKIGQLSLLLWNRRPIDKVLKDKR